MQSFFFPTAAFVFVAVNDFFHFFRLLTFFQQASKNQTLFPSRHRQEHASVHHALLRAGKI